ncbi:MAG: hypothetical protein FIA92_07600 [Chloroflexi bacterium]|nr:hypothetical protein [Chloroflexota bacterium]
MPIAGEAVDQFARWLLVAVALDLLVTRFVVRLAIFVPKGEPYATIGAILGRIGAATDVLVPILGILLLGALLVRAGRTGRRLEQAVLVAVTVVAFGGLALVVYPPTPFVVTVLGVLTAAPAALAGIQIGLRPGLSATARAGLAFLALAVAAAAASRALGALGAAFGLATWPDGVDGPALGVVGQASFVAGAGLVGLAGLHRAILTGSLRRPAAAAGAVAALAVVVAGAGASLTWGALSIWSLGLTGAIPVPAVALGMGLALAGLPSLHQRAPSAAVGAGIVLLAGYGLAASGLVLASLLGLMVAACGRAEPTASGTATATAERTGH